MKRRLVNERFPEEVALKNLLQSSKEFIEFYTAQRQKITCPLKWEKAYNLGEADGAASNIGNDVIIHLRRIPAPLSDAYLVAHEMQHVVHREYDKIPVASWTHPQAQILAGSIASSVHDLLVDRDLFKFGFDISKPFLIENMGKERRLETIPKEPDKLQEKEKFIRWAVNHAANIADDEFINREYDLDGYSYIKWYEARYPNTAAEGRKIYEVLGQVDLLSNESIYNYQEWVIKEYDLGEWIRIKV